MTSLAFSLLILFVSTGTYSETPPSVDFSTTDHEPPTTEARAYNEMKSPRLRADEIGGRHHFLERNVPTAVARPASGGTLIYAYEVSGNSLISFDAANPGVLVSSTPLVGINSGTGEFLASMDIRPLDGLLYGIVYNGLFSTRLVRINPASGVTTQIGIPVAAPLGIFWGGDFDPVDDRFREISNIDTNRRFNVFSGSLAGADAGLAYAIGDANVGNNPSVVHAAYSNNDPTASHTTLYGIDSTTDSLVSIGRSQPTTVSPNTGQLFTVGHLGLNITNFGGFDIEKDTGLGYAALRSAGVSNFYEINLATGASTLIGPIGTGTIVDGLTVALPPNTLEGSNVVAENPFGNASAQFSNVSTAGFTSFTPIDPSSAGPPPTGYTVVAGSTAYDVTTTAIFTNSVTVCFATPVMTTQDFALVRVLHGENEGLVDRTILAPDSPAPDFGTFTVCARIDSLSPFVLAFADDNDSDGVPDISDNCPMTANSDQADFDLDGIGDLCDPLTGPPTNKDQCKGNGWRRFNVPRTFKNQGDCVSSVNTGR